ncbi:DUF3489 domain-containing protein [Sphingomonas sp. LB-2]|uniref:DUF3489 domain-containing protein n=1 Tax=Sphingomonas caeni TaxID=2984949 RepID=UPI0022309D35|nr:DUF3489 domain-containing protein [Sphingomonas caeni]MCW3848105.1 DUF3489 domain-containing protein [Sphingomonas caeni]
MTQLSDTQTVLLSNASKRDGGSVYPYPNTLTAPASAIAKSVLSLLKQGMVEERETTAICAWRADGDIHYGIFVTPAGLSAIGIGEPGPESNTPVVPTQQQPARLTKAALVLELLRREHGATLGDLIEATGWLPHTTRAALTGLRKKGHTIAKSKRGDVTCYQIGTQA